MFEKNIKIKEEFKTIYKKNKISGHSYQIQSKITGYSVTGGGWLSETFKSLKKAELEKKFRENYLKNHPNWIDECKKQINLS